MVMQTSGRVEECFERVLGFVCGRQCLYSRLFNKGLAMGLSDIFLRTKTRFLSRVDQQNVQRIPVYAIGTSTVVSERVVLRSGRRLEWGSPGRQWQRRTMGEDAIVMSK